MKYFKKSRPSLIPMPRASDYVARLGAVVVPVLEGKLSAAAIALILSVLRIVEWVWSHAEMHGCLAWAPPGTAGAVAPGIPVVIGVLRGYGLTGTALVLLVTAKRNGRLSGAFRAAAGLVVFVNQSAQTDNASLVVGHRSLFL